MFQRLGLALVAFFIAYLCFVGVFNFLEDNYGVQIPLGENLFISQNRGENWVALKTPDKNEVSGVSVVFDPQNPNNLYMASAEGIFKTSQGNQGKNFSTPTIKFEEELKSSLVSNFITDPQNPNTLYLISEEVGRNKLLVSPNNGKDFKTLFIAQSNDRIKSFAIDPFYSNRLYLGTEGGGFLKSEDFGNSWKEINNFSQPIQEIVLNPHQEGEIYLLISAVAKDPFNVYNNGLSSKAKISRDSGKTFQNIEEKINISRITQQLGNLPEIKKIVIDPFQNCIYFITDHHLLRSIQDQMELIKLVSFSKEEKITTFTVDPKNSNILYIGIGNLIYVSEDSGENWRIIEPPARGEIESIKINPANPNTILISIKNTF